MTHRKYSPRSAPKTHKMAITLLIALIAGTGLWAVASAVDDDGAKGYGGRHGGPAHMLSRHLDLTDEQETRVGEIIESARSEGKILRAELGGLRQEVAASIRENGYAEDQIRMLIESRAPQMIDLMMLRIRTMAEIYELLTPEQKARADDFLEHGPGFGRGRFRSEGFGSF